MLQGEESKGAEFVSQEKVQKCNTNNSSSFLLQTFYIAPATNGDYTSSQIQNLMDIYANVFEEPDGFPPPRSHDHHIPLLPEGKLIRVHLYRYPNYQKTEIEQLVCALL